MAAKFSFGDSKTALTLVVFCGPTGFVYTDTDGIEIVCSKVNVPKIEDNFQICCVSQSFVISFEIKPKLSQ